MRILQTIALILLASMAAAQTSEKLAMARQFKEGAAYKYRITAKMNGNGGEAEIKGLVEAKTLKAVKDGKASVEFKCTDFSETVNGIVNSELPNTLATSVDKHNMPETLSVSDGGSMYVALAVASYLPGNEVVKGESFKINWEGKDKGGSVIGKGSVIDIKTENGIKIAVVKSKVEVIPAGQSAPADLEVTSEFNLADGTLLKSSVKGHLPEGAITFTVDLVK